MQSRWQEEYRLCRSVSQGGAKAVEEKYLVLRSWMHELITCPNILCSSIQRATRPICCRGFDISAWFGQLWSHRPMRLCWPGGTVRWGVDEKVSMPIGHSPLLPDEKSESRLQCQNTFTISASNRQYDIHNVGSWATSFQQPGCHHHQSQMRPGASLWYCSMQLKWNIWICDQNSQRRPILNRPRSMIDGPVDFHCEFPKLGLMVTVLQAPIYHLRDGTGDSGR